MSCSNRIEQAKQSASSMGATCPQPAVSPRAGLIAAARAGKQVTFDDVVALPDFDQLTVQEILDLGNPTRANGWSLAHELISRHKRTFTAEELLQMGNPHTHGGMNLYAAHMLVANGQRFTVHEIEMLGNPADGSWGTLAHWQVNHGWKDLSVADIIRLSNTKNQYGETLVDSLMKRCGRRFTYPDLVRMGQTLDTTPDGLPILWQETINTSRWHTFRHGKMTFKHTGTYRVTIVQSGPDAEDVDFRIEFADWQYDESKNEWMPVYRQLPESKTVQMDQLVMRWAADRCWSFEKEADNRPPFTFQGKPIPAEAQELARQVAPYATMDKYFHSLQAVFPPTDKQDFDTRRETFLALLPKLGFGLRARRLLSESLSRPQAKSLASLHKTRYLCYLKHAKPLQYRIVEELIKNLDADQPPDSLTDSLSPLLNPLFSDAQGNVQVMPPAEDDSWAATAARLAHGLEVDFDTLLRYPDLMAQYGA